MNRGVFSAEVVANKRINTGCCRLELSFSGPAAQAIATAVPGQFLQLDLAGACLPPVQDIPPGLADASARNILLRRPFSFAAVTAKAKTSTAEILYRAVGPASLRMTALSAGRTVTVIGPLGNGFRIPQNIKTALLIVGGMGAGPLLFLAKLLTAKFPQMNVFAFAGAKKAAELPFAGRLDALSAELGYSIGEFASLGIESSIATDDGSLGFHGPVTDCFADRLKEKELPAEGTVIFACGPEAMLAKVAQIAAQRKIECQVSMERMMACGIGTCQSCAIECRLEGSKDTVYKLCCKDGPVFNSNEVVFRT